MSDTTSPEPKPESAATPAAPASVPAASAPAATPPAGKPAAPKKHETPAEAEERRARRGTVIAGAVTLPLITLGVVLLAVPLAVWYLSTVIRTLVVVVANIVSGSGAAKDANSTLGQIDPAALGGVTLGFAIVGAVFVIAAWLFSFFVLRAHRVERPGYVTGFGVTVGLVIATVLTATVGALTGLLFGTARTVGQVLGNAALSIALTGLGSVAVTVVTGILVWLWMSRIFRTRVADPAT
ncbi:hypothetical protein H4J02_03045 [Protaetiibacter sp. SSC-01]|uniref:hypothetical protein n=1 Tax=Protaetiibacter sp. SSC-01 TaxID=2759943 RepID=UPI0016575461|nr:hypothetical protein [Protaetiibacter sp. SSC-01]QNO38020.1 hypothetical protein H4J02_03045 [Protaetiibacter sp. SSC-01]